MTINVLTRNNRVDILNAGGYWTVTLYLEIEYAGESFHERLNIAQLQTYSGSYKYAYVDIEKLHSR